MDKVITDILDALREGDLDAQGLDRIIRAESRRQGDGRRRIAKKRILPYFLAVRDQGGERWEQWAVTPQLEERFIACLRMKPRRTASGVATITVITKPWPCSGQCIFCPNDVRMPKSYLHDEPACQRAERAFFDPYLQVASRLQALEAMGHPTQKVELIVLGGTWTDYDKGYRLWFATELFRCLNDETAVRADACAERRAAYEGLGLSCDGAVLAERSQAVQQAVNRGELSFNQAHGMLYGPGTPWEQAARFQRGTWEELERQHRINEGATHRCVGLVMETRPDALGLDVLLDLRRMGCTKVQMGIQSLDAAILAGNGRPIEAEALADALDRARLLGFKTHVHFMVNLMDATPQADAQGYRRLMEDERFKPDEVKLYPCALVKGTGLMECWRTGRWRPYTEDELMAVLMGALEATPPFTRVSRMIRDISSDDIVAGNKKTNLRQMVEEALGQKGAPVQEIRYRELRTDEADLESLELKVVPYDTRSTRERFLQWVTAENRIVGFLRLSLPKDGALDAPGMPLKAGEAMIREVHVYGAAARLSQEGSAAQHHGLGRALVQKSCQLAREAGYERLNVISAVGTRQYYRSLGFQDNGLYQTLPL